MEMIDIQPAKMTIDGKEYVAELATIEDTTLGYEDHGIGTAALHFSGPAWGQSNEARCLSEYDKVTQKQRGTAFGFDLVLRMIDVVGCRTWERLRGANVYVLREERFGSIVGIASTEFDRYLIFADHHKEFYGRGLDREDQ
jgi:hypothetical protein